MVKRFFAIFIAFTLVLNFTVRADGDDEGMWLPLLVQKLNMKKMKKMGLKLTAEEIYSINKGSLKDAIVVLDGGSCTGELVSADGLFLTNHHCGYGEIQAHSSVEHDYLTEGFWAKTRKDELANPAKTVTFLISIVDVTDKINEKLTDEMTEQARDLAIRKASSEIEKGAIDKDWYEAKVQSFFKGNNYYLFVYETYRDVRLVGAPPSSIGKFGADTDNWMWPRHTGDFSMFRIYCGPDGKPADYSEENVPYHPKHFLPISLKGYQKDDFAMVLGYPGTTTRYLSSWGVKQTMENENKIKIKLRGIKQEIIKAEMDKSDKVRIQYASKYSRSTNHYKYSIGQNKGLNALNVIEKKKAIETDLTKWINSDDNRKKEYGDALSLIENGVKDINKYDVVQKYWFECFWGGPEIISASFGTYNGLSRALQSGDTAAIEEIKKTGEVFFKDFYLPVDKEVFLAMVKAYKNDIDKEFHPAFFKDVEKDYEGDFVKFADKLYSTSIFTDKGRYDEFMKNPDISVLNKDLGFATSQSIIRVYFSFDAAVREIQAKIQKGERLFVKALLEKEKDIAHYPDANSTMRFTYGKVGDYSVDGKKMPFKTYLSEYVKKEKKGAPKNDEFYVHQRLKDLYKKKNYGVYGEKNKKGKDIMPVCFTTDNDITGGNSGSPVINGSGELIGIAFDGNWEAMSGDIAFETELQKCINVDIRFVLFVIDKYAGAKHLIKEMKIVK